MSDQRERLVEVRDQIKLRIQDADEKALPALSREYRAVLAAIDSIPAEDEKATSDDLAERRTQRQAEAQARARSEK